MKWEDPQVLVGRVDGFAAFLERQMRAAQEPDRVGAPPTSNPRGVLAALRSALSGDKRDFMRAMPHVAEFLGEEEHDSDRWLFVTGALCGWHPKPGALRSQSLGEAAAPLREKSGSMTSHFAALLACHERDLPAHLRKIVGLLRANDTPVSWRQLLHDLALHGGWSHPERRVQERWARDFYRKNSDDAKSGFDFDPDLSTD